MDFDNYRKLNSILDNNYWFLVFNLVSKSVYKYRASLDDEIVKELNGHDIYKEIHKDDETQYIDLTDDDTTYETLYPNYGKLEIDSDHNEMNDDLDDIFNAEDDEWCDDTQNF